MDETTITLSMDEGYDLPFEVWGNHGLLDEPLIDLSEIIDATPDCKFRIICLEQFAKSGIQPDCKFKGICLEQCHRRNDDSLIIGIKPDGKFRAINLETKFAKFGIKPDCKFKGHCLERFTKSGLTPACKFKVICFGAS